MSEIAKHVIAAAVGVQLRHWSGLNLPAESMAVVMQQLDLIALAESCGKIQEQKVQGARDAQLEEADALGEKG